MKLVVSLAVGGGVWALLYWGVMLPIKSVSVTAFGTGSFGADSYAFMVGVPMFFGMTAFIALFYWFWQQSNKRDLVGY